MKTKQFKNIFTLASILVLMLVSSPIFATDPDPGLPGDNTVAVDDQVQAPIDQDIWLGVLGGCLIAAYFVSKPKNVLTK